MNVIRGILSLLAGIPRLAGWLWSLAGGITEGVIRGVVRAKNEPRTVRYYPADTARLDHMRECIDRMRRSARDSDPDRGP